MSAISASRKESRGEFEFKKGVRYVFNILVNLNAWTFPREVNSIPSSNWLPIFEVYGDGEPAILKLLINFRLPNINVHSVR